MEWFLQITLLSNYTKQSKAITVTDTIKYGSKGERWLYPNRHRLQQKLQQNKMPEVWRRLLPSDSARSNAANIDNLRIFDVQT